MMPSVMFHNDLRIYKWAEPYGRGIMGVPWCPAEFLEPFLDSTGNAAQCTDTLCWFLNNFIPSCPGESVFSPIVQPRQFRVREVRFPAVTQPGQ